MEQISRRSLLGGAIVLATAVCAPASALFAGLPVLHGDGEHDDTEALQALFDGKPVHILSDSITVHSGGGAVFLRGGEYQISAPLRLRSKTNIDRCHFRNNGNGAIDLSGAHDCTISRVRFSHGRGPAVFDGRGGKAIS